MKLSITRGQRSLLLFLSASSYIGWFAGLGARIDAQGIAGTSVASITISPPPAVPRVSDAIERDPFANSPDPGPQPHDGPREPTQVSHSRDEAVPDIGDEPAAEAAVLRVAATEAPMTLAVRATIVGRTAVAYVADGSAMDIVRVGDSLGGRRIAKIDLEGITFAGGSRLDLAADQEPAPAPTRMRAPGLSISLDRLRALLAERVPAPSPTAEIGSPRASSPTTPAPLFTPDAIRTVDAAGIAPGTNPTPDLRDPTAYPYPYPYAPAIRR